MIFSMACKNILRNKKRTIISGSALFLVAFVICFIMAIEYGSLEDMRLNVMNHETGTIRLRNPLYSENERITPLSLYIENTADVIETVKKIDGVESVEPKIKTSAAIYKNGETESASLVGTDFNSCSFFDSKDNTIVEGSIDSIKLDNKDAKNVAIVTDVFARTFDLHADDKFTFMARTASGGTNGVTVKVGCVIHLADADYAKDTFFLDFAKLSKILRMNGNATELLVVTNEIANTNYSVYVKDLIQKALPDLEAKIWTEISGYYAMFESADIMYFVFALIFFALAATVIFNSTMMSVMERKKEIGTLLSLGMEAKTVRVIFLLETVITSAISTLLGCVLGAIVVTIFNRVGLDMTKLGYDTLEGINYTTMLYPSLSFGRYVEFFLTGFLTAVVACLIPSRMALKVQPAEALRTEN